jgi:hypothetical protein
VGETWKFGGLIWRGTWQRAETVFLGAALVIRFSGGDWGARVNGESVGHASSREAAMRLAKSRCPRPDRCPTCGHRIAPGSPSSEEPTP